MTSLGMAEMQIKSSLLQLDVVRLGSVRLGGSN